MELSAGAKAILERLRGYEVRDHLLLGRYADLFNDPEERRACVRELVQKGVVEEFERNEAVALTPNGYRLLNSN